MAKKKKRPAKAGAGTPRKKKSSKSASSKRLAELKQRFLSKGKRDKAVAARRKSAPKDAAPDARSQAESVVLAEMPGVKIVRAARGNPSDAAQKATAQGSSLAELRQKYAGRSLRDSSQRAPLPPLESTVVLVQHESDADQDMGPKAVIVRRGKIRGFQG